MSANWLIHIDHQTLQTQRINRTEGDAGRATKTPMFIHLKDLSLHSRHDTSRCFYFLRLPLPHDFPWKIDLR